MPIVKVKTSGSLKNKNVLEQNEKPCSTSVIEALIPEKNEEPDSTSIPEKNEEPGSTKIIEALTTEKQSSILVTENKEVDSTLLIDHDSEVVNTNNTDVKIDICSKTNDKCEKTTNERGQKRKNTSKKESKPVKKMPPMKTPRTEVVERKGALLEAVS